MRREPVSSCSAEEADFQGLASQCGGTSAVHTSERSRAEVRGSGEEAAAKGSPRSKPRWVAEVSLAN